MKRRIAFTGCSGSGKSTLAQWISEEYKLPMNPIGSRSVAKEMGFASPYDVDKAGKRAEFQERLLQAKKDWESERSDFVTDRTPVDNLVYTMMHDVHSITDVTLKKVGEACKHYTVIFYCPFNVVCRLADDSQRVQELTYHRLYDMILRGVFDELNFYPLALSMSDLEARKSAIRLRMRSAVPPF